jgi:predicted nucleic acid-binding protein
MRQKRIYLDTSAYLLRFSDEKPLSEAISLIFRKCEEGKLTLVTSLWTLSEGVAALDQAIKVKGNIARPQIQHHLVIAWADNRPYKAREP